MNASLVISAPSFAYSDTTGTVNDSRRVSSTTIDSPPWRKARRSLKVAALIFLSLRFIAIPEARAGFKDWYVSHYYGHPWKATFSVAGIVLAVVAVTIFTGGVGDLVLIGGAEFAAPAGTIFVGTTIVTPTVTVGGVAAGTSLVLDVNTIINYKFEANGEEMTIPVGYDYQVIANPDGTSTLRTVKRPR